MLNGLSLYLVSNGYLEKSQALLALSASCLKQIPFTIYLGQQHYITYAKLAEAIANYFTLPLVDLTNYPRSSILNNLLTAEMIQKNFVLPLSKTENKISLAVADPSLVDVDEINFLTGLTVELLIVELDQLLPLIDDTCCNQFQANILPEESIIQTGSDLAQVTSDQSPLVLFLNNILLTAINKGASDIHFECYEEYLRIRLRLDGILSELNRQSIKLASYLIARLKIMADLDISERRLPQDGHFKMLFTHHPPTDFRISVCPTLYGEKAVVRIQKDSMEVFDLDTLGMNALQKKLFIQAINCTQGMILVTGPTGSGKTATLYTALTRLNTPEVNILTIEDPVEIYLAGINQVQINLKADLTFPRVLRAFLRQDPDIIMIGEIRDSETADSAVKAAQTGHLVLSTLHTNSATETLIRLANIGIVPFNIASSISLIIAQRLVRRLCHHCKVKTNIPAPALIQQGFNQEEAKEITLFRAQGCQYCNQGYRGRIGIYEVLSISHALAKLIMQNASPTELMQQARNEHFITIREAGIEKVKEGITSLEEVNRLLRD